MKLKEKVDLALVTRLQQCLNSVRIIWSYILIYDCDQHNSSAHLLCACLSTVHQDGEIPMHQCNGTKLVLIVVGQYMNYYNQRYMLRCHHKQMHIAHQTIGIVYHQLSCTFAGIFERPGGYSRNKKSWEVYTAWSTHDGFCNQQSSKKFAGMGSCAKVPNTMRSVFTTIFTTNTHISVLAMPARPVEFTRYFLTQWISKFPGIFEIQRVRQYLVNVVLFDL